MGVLNGWWRKETNKKTGESCQVEGEGAAMQGPAGVRFEATTRTPALSINREHRPRLIVGLLCYRAGFKFFHWGSFCTRKMSMGEQSYKDLSFIIR